MIMYIYIYTYIYIYDNIYITRFLGPPKADTENERKTMIRMHVYYYAFENMYF